MKVSNRTLIAFTAGILLLAVGAWGLVRLLLPGGTQVVVTVDGKHYGTYSLHRDQTVVIEPGDGSWHNTLQISGGEASVVESDCDNQICVYTPPLNESLFGVIVCLPHGVIVELAQ